MLQIKLFGQLLELEGTGGAAIPYLRCVKVNLQIPGITNYNEDVLLPVIQTVTYSKTVPVMIGSKVIDRALSLMTKGELAKVTTTWRQVHFGAVMSGLVQLTCTSSDKTKMGVGISHPSMKSDPMEGRKFCLNDIKAPVNTTQKVTIPPFSTVNVQADSSVKGHCIWVHILTEPAPGPQLPTAVVPTATYGELHCRSSWVHICLWNLSTHAVEIPTKAMVGQVAPANQVPLVVHPTRTSKESNPKSQNDGSWRPWTSKVSKSGLNQSRDRPESYCSSRAPVCMQWSGPGQNCSDQAQNRVNWLDALQRALLMHTPSHVWWCEDPYPGDAGYWCNPQIAQYTEWHSRPGLEKRMTVWGSVSASGSWTTRLWRMHTHYLALTNTW